MACEGFDEIGAGSRAMHRHAMQGELGLVQTITQEFEDLHQVARSIGDGPLREGVEVPMVQNAEGARGREES